MLTRARAEIEKVFASEMKFKFLQRWLRNWTNFRIIRHTNSNVAELYSLRTKRKNRAPDTDRKVLEQLLPNDRKICKQGDVATVYFLLDFYRTNQLWPTVAKL